MVRGDECRPAILSGAVCPSEFLPNVPRIDYSINKGFAQGNTFDVLMIGGWAATTENLPSLSGRPVSKVSFQMDPKLFRDWLKERIFAGKSCPRFLRVPTFLEETYCRLFFFLGYILDSGKLRNARNGLTLRGPGIAREHRPARIALRA